MGVPVMRKWILIFLLLANVVALFGFTMFEKKISRQKSVDIERAFTLRLVSEVASESLQKVSSETKPLIVAGIVVEECFFYEKIATQSEADVIAGFMVEQGFAPRILVKSVMQDEFKLVIRLPKGEREKQIVVESLRNEGVRVAVSANSIAPEMIIGKFLTQAAAQMRLDELPALENVLEIREGVYEKMHYSIRLVVDIDRKLINKINDVLKNKYKSLKIVKKVC